MGFASAVTALGRNSATYAIMTKALV
jgi:hypothetical protein